MTYPRSSLVCLDDTRWYHCVSRCVRRAFLCGEDSLSGRNYEHRRHWITRRIKALAHTFAIDIAAYAVMGNHYHLVVRVAKERAATWTQSEVATRWTTIFAARPVISRYLKHGDAALNATELTRLESTIEIWRHRLHDLSWFARVLNESIAKMANAEDNCRGRFWEGRFHTQALLDEAALLAAMVYVDLNPLRAGLAEVPESAPHTSFHERLRINQKATDEASKLLAPLMRFDPHCPGLATIPFNFHDYVELVDWFGRQHRDHKRGRIAENQPPILERIGLNPEAFIDMSDHLLTAFGRAVGKPEHLAALCGRQQVKFVRGIGAARKAFGRNSD